MPKKTASAEIKEGNPVETKAVPKEEEEDEVEQDERIAKLASFVEKHEPSEVVDYLDNTLGGKSGIIYGGICFNEEFSKAHFLIMATLHTTDGTKLTVQIDTRKAILKAWASTPEKQRAFLLAMELYIIKERRRGIARYDEVLRKLWENDVAQDDEVSWWQTKEKALQEFYPEFKIDDAVAIRESAVRFVDWMLEGECE